MTRLSRLAQRAAAGTAAVGGGVIAASSLASLFTIDGTSTIGPRLDASVGPNAILRSAGYPLPAATDLTGSPLTAITPEDTRWLFDGTNEGDLLVAAWGSLTKPYVKNNDPSNLGGVVPDGGMVIDGFPVAEGSYVFQFCDFQHTSINLVEGAPGVLLRGCRNRGAWGTSPGAINCGSWTGELHLHYCDVGGQSALTAGGAQYGISASGGHNFSLYRNYVSYTCDSLVVNPQEAGYCEVVENVIEKISLYPDTGEEHLDGLQTNGNTLNMRILRNKMVIPAADDEGNLINQTGGISLFQDFGTFPGTGANLDDSIGYVIDGNYMGGMGYCFYLGLAGGNPAHSVANLAFTNNRITTAIYSTGGANGPITFPPPWGTDGNVESGNEWADGDLAGQSFV